MRRIARIMRMVSISEATLSPSSSRPQTPVGLKQRENPTSGPTASEMLSARNKKGLIKTRGEGAGGKARAVDPPHGDGIAFPNADSRKLAYHQRQGKPHVLADMLVPAHRSAIHETRPVSYAKAGGAMTSCQNHYDCGIA